MTEKTLTIDDVLQLSYGDLKTFLGNYCDVSDDTCWMMIPRGSKNKRVTLVAHIDTFFDTSYDWKGTGRDKVRIFHDPKHRVYWSPDGLGADDRAGVYGILSVYNSLPDNLKPNLLFTDLEETGGYGAIDASEVFQAYLEKSLAFIELDRKNGKDCVFYNGEPKKFRNYIESFGFITSIGSFSDISILGEELNICGANLSIGYFGEHTRGEYLDLNLMEGSIEKTKRIVSDMTKRQYQWKHTVKRRNRGRYVQFDYDPADYYSYWGKEEKPGKHLPKDHVLPVDDFINLKDPFYYRR